MKELLQLLQRYRENIAADDGSDRAFASLFKQGVELLDLDDEDVARIFNASRPTASRWRRGKSTPVPALRRQVIAELRKAVDSRIKRFEKRSAAVGGYAAELEVA